MEEETSLRIKKKTKDKLDKIGHKNESYNNIIERLLTFFKGGKRKWINID